MMAVGARANDHGRRTDSVPIKSAHPGSKGQLHPIALRGGGQCGKGARCVKFTAVWTGREEARKGMKRFEQEAREGTEGGERFRTAGFGLRIGLAGGAASCWACIGR